MIKGLAPQSPLLLPPRDLIRLSSEPGRWEEDLDILLGKLFPGMSAHLLSSGRTCLFILLMFLKEKSASSRNTVILPAYTCPSVPYTVNKAGLGVVLCDFKPRSFTLDEGHLENLIGDRTLAVLPTHLFGIPTGMAGTNRIAASKGVAVIEDFAHAVGASLDGQPVGTFGDYSFTSLGRGKMITSDEGGILLVSRKKKQAGLEESIAGLKSEKRHKSGLVFRLGVLFSLIVGKRWGVIARSRIDPEKRDRDYAFQPGLLSGIQRSLLRECLLRLDDFSRSRQERSAFLTRALQGLEGIFLPASPEGGVPVNMMYPLIFEDRDRMVRVYSRLRKEGLGPSRMYRHTLKTHLRGAYVNGSDDLPEAESMAENLITIPCHPFVSLSDLERVVGVISRS